MLGSVELQREALNASVEKRFIKTSTAVKGPYTSGDYVRWKLNQIFGPDNWSHTIIQGPELITINEKNAYIRVIIRLTVQFANGQQVIHEDVGIWTLTGSRDKATGERHDLEHEAPERYETIEKAVITDGIKACCEYLGICFRPVADETLNREAQRTTGIVGPEQSSQVTKKGKEEKKPKVTASEFWSRYNQVVRDTGRAIERKSLEITKAQQTSEWEGALAWLNQQVEKEKAG